MPVNAGPEYMKAELEYAVAKTPKEKLEALRKMLQLSPKHKSSEKLVADIKKKIAKLLEQEEKERQRGKRTGRKEGIKKEGAARICIVGSTNSGKSTLLNLLTNAKPEISAHQFTTIKPEIGAFNYQGIIIQVIEIPAIVENFSYTEHGREYASIIRESDMLILTFSNENEKKLVEHELKEIDINLLNVSIIEINKVEIDKEFFPNLKEKIWNNLSLILVYTKQPHREKDFPPIALPRNSRVEELAKKVHKDFLKNFKFARVYGKSAKFHGQQVGLDHILEDGDAIELYVKK